MRARGWPLVWACLLASGCAAFVQKSDYLDYRAVRMERRDAPRLLAMQRYVAHHPQGHWHDEVQRERQQRDRPVFEAGKGDRAGLTLYLKAFPDGAFVAQAKARLSAIDVIRQRKQEEAARAKLLAEQRKQREAELSRTWVTRFFGYWVKTLLALDGWGEPIAQLAHRNPAFSRAFGRPPRPRCTADECLKYYESAYAVPVPGGTRLERTMRLILRLRMEGGKVVRAELLLPGLGFSRWEELEERHPVVDGDPEARAQAVQWALSRISGVLDEAAAGRQPLSGYALGPLPKPALGPSGELVDTTAMDPGAPANRIQGAGAPEPASGIEQLVKPAAPEQAPDMEMAPLRVGPDGRPLPATGEMVLEPMVVPKQGAAGASGGTMEMAPLTVPPAPGEGGVGAVQAGDSAPAATPAQPPAGAAAAPSAPAPVQPAPAPVVTQAFQQGGLRLVVFAAASDAAAPAYDGLLIEQAQDASKGRGKGRGKGGGKGAAAAGH